ncbi:MAG: helix-turn-helix domain-containing protein [Chitinophagaceae bacterium]|jgi:AraC-like DNA-binding protein|nr:helix-turn-helix domain-containing protein [Chitinophagaceae bacterium]
MSLLLLALAKWIIILILLVYQHRRNSGNLLLAGGLLMMSLFDINHYLAISGISKHLTAIFYLYSSPWVTLIGPFFYLYIRNTLADQNRLYWMDLVHTIPFWLMWANHIPYFELPFDDKLAYAEQIHRDLNAVREPSHYLLIGHFPLNILRGLLSLGYLLACGWRLYRYFRRIPEHPEVPLRQTKLTLRWLSFFIATLTIVSVFYVLVVLDMKNKHLSAASFQASNAYVLLLVFYGPLSLSLLFFPEILYGLPRAKTAITNNPSTVIKTSLHKIINPEDSKHEVEDVDIPQKHHPTENDPFQELANRILEYIHADRPYLQPGFSVTDLSIQFEVPRHHIDYCFSRVMLEKFTEMRKRLRVEHAKSLLTAHHNLSMEGIGKESGFASKSSFFSSFREVMGMTPAEFIRSTSESADMLPG